MSQLETHDRQRLDRLSWTEGNRYTYRGYQISPDRDCPKVGLWSYAHEDYDGPPDNRCGFATSLDGVKTEIDDLIDGYPDRHLYHPFCNHGLVCHGRDPS